AQGIQDNRSSPGPERPADGGDDSRRAKRRRPAGRDRSRGRHAPPPDSPRGRPAGSVMKGSRRQTVLHGTCLLGGVHSAGSDLARECPVLNARKRSERTQKAAQTRARRAAAPPQRAGDTPGPIGLAMETETPPSSPQAQP